MTTTRIRLATRCTVALGWLALALCATKSFAVDPVPPCTSYMVKVNYCVPAAQLTKCADWDGNANGAACVASGRDVIQKKKTECATIPDVAIGYYHNVCIDATDAGQPVLELCSEQFKCVSENTGTAQAPMLICKQGAPVIPPDRRNAKTNSNDCEMVAPIIIW